MPAAEVLIDEALIRRLLRTQAHAIPGAADLALVHAADGWDCSVWRLGARFAVRLPRRALSAPLVVHEQEFLPAVAARLSGVGVPAPIVSGRADATYPWPWSVVPWFDGQSGLTVPRPGRSGWASTLAGALGALHIPAVGRHPSNPYRGGPLALRDETFRERLASVESASSYLPSGVRRTLERIWDLGLAAARVGEPVWIHGDLHPGNLIARGGDLVAVIDFGDLTAGDPAYDLAIAWLAFDEPGRLAFRDAAGGYDEGTWTRARAWAAAFTAMLLQHSDDNPAYLRLGQECLAELTG